MDGIRADRNRQVRAVYDRAQEVLREVRTVVKGKDTCVEKAFSAILAGGHILIEDVPGVGKTTLAVAFSHAMALETHRVQFTPDVQPSDILGFSMYHKDTGAFSYHPGPVMCNLFLADEINRTSPKTQSALLEVMEEGAVTVDGESHPVPAPFIVMATQNPRGSAGTQLLPDSQLDRFMITMRMGYPDMEDEVEIARGRSQRVRPREVRQVLAVQELLELQNLVEQIFIHDNLYKYIVRLSEATRQNNYVELGVSPRGTIACTRMARARAFLQGRSYVIPEDVAAVFPDVAVHRLQLGTRARVAHVTAEVVLEQILQQEKQPVSYMRN
ncbi:MAG: MoxR family ATPase [Lachnospiraceae bacterium]|nr:MoxR family ATPase [Lachnospiraceae bacterium]